MSDQAANTVLKLTAQVVSAYLANNEVTAETLVPLIRSVQQSLAAATALVSLPAATQMPAVPVRKSVFPDFIICLEDGKKRQALTRYLKVRFDLSPEAYRTKWGLPSDYPMLAPSYASKRSDMAKQAGFGRKRITVSASPKVTQLPARHAHGAK